MDDELARDERPELTQPGPPDVTLRATAPVADAKPALAREPGDGLDHPAVRAVAIAVAVARSRIVIAASSSTPPAARPGPPLAQAAAPEPLPTIPPVSPIAASKDDAGARQKSAVVAAVDAMRQAAHILDSQRAAPAPPAREPQVDPVAPRPAVEPAPSPIKPANMALLAKVLAEAQEAPPVRPGVPPPLPPRVAEPTSIAVPRPPPPATEPSPPAQPRLPASAVRVGVAHSLRAPAPAMPPVVPTLSAPTLAKPTLAMPPVVPSMPAQSTFTRIPEPLAVPLPIPGAVARPGVVRRAAGALWRMAQAVVRALILLLLAVGLIWTLALVAYRYIDPPASTLMLGHTLTGRPVTQRWVPLERISLNLIRSVITSEDGNFCRHRGVDWRAIDEALDKAAEEGGRPRGASTISMQTVKNLLLWPQAHYIRKVLELPLAYAAEKAWGKRRMLELYLNVAEWGPGIFGAEAASQHHFRKSAAALSVREATLLAVSLPNPIERNAGRPGPGTLRLARLNETRAARATLPLGCLGTPR
jgi:monofunctional glycosyltransferase